MLNVQFISDEHERVLVEVPGGEVTVWDDGAVYYRPDGATEGKAIRYAPTDPLSPEWQEGDAEYRTTV